MYKIEQCYKDCEQILKKPLNYIDYDIVRQWYDRYTEEHIHTCMLIAKESPNAIRNCKYMDSIMYNHSIYFNTLSKNYIINEKDHNDTNENKLINELKNVDWL